MNPKSAKTKSGQPNNGILKKCATRFKYVPPPSSRRDPPQVKFCVPTEMMIRSAPKVSQAWSETAREFVLPGNRAPSAQRRYEPSSFPPGFLHDFHDKEPEYSGSKIRQTSYFRTETFSPNNPLRSAMNLDLNYRNQRTEVTPVQDLAAKRETFSGRYDVLHSFPPTDLELQAFLRSKTREKEKETRRSRTAREEDILEDILGVRKTEPEECLRPKTRKTELEPKTSLSSMMREKEKESRRSRITREGDVLSLFRTEEVEEFLRPKTRSRETEMEVQASLGSMMRESEKETRHSRINRDGGILGLRTKGDETFLRPKTRKKELEMQHSDETFNLQRKGRFRQGRNRQEIYSPPPDEYSEYLEVNIWKFSKNVNKRRHSPLRTVLETKTEQNNEVNQSTTDIELDDMDVINL